MKRQLKYANNPHNGSETYFLRNMSRFPFTGWRRERTSILVPSSGSLSRLPLSGAPARGCGWCVFFSYKQQQRSAYYFSRVSSSYTILNNNHAPFPFRGENAFDQIINRLADLGDYASYQNEIVSRHLLRDQYYIQIMESNHLPVRCRNSSE